MELSLRGKSSSLLLVFRLVILALSLISTQTLIREEYLVTTEGKTFLKTSEISEEELATIPEEELARHRETHAPTSAPTISPTRPRNYAHSHYHGIKLPGYQHPPQRTMIQEEGTFYHGQYRETLHLELISDTM
jgi:hypothetical protein